jgi:hypothetical protein
VGCIAVTVSLVGSAADRLVAHGAMSVGVVGLTGVRVRCCAACKGAGPAVDASTMSVSSVSSALLAAGSAQPVDSSRALDE